MKEAKNIAARLNTIKDGTNMTKISASILACNTAYLGESVKCVEQAGAHYIHIDIMDGRYVDNLTFGPQTIMDLKKVTSLPIEVHLEMYEPERFLNMFQSVGADRLVIQRETCYNPIRLLNRIHEMGMEAGMAINPGEDVSLLKYLLKYMDFAVIMSVEPGFGGQVFERSCFDKIKTLNKTMKEQGINIPIAVDGGINIEIGNELKRKGADILVVGSGIFQTENVHDTIQSYLNG
jgi:ribulose-phosphate 3-epimerase